MFHPMAFTVVARADGARWCFSVTFVPAAVARSRARQGRGARERRHARARGAPTSRCCALRCASASRPSPAPSRSSHWRARSRRAWAASSSRAWTKATSRCTRCASRAPASSRRSACSSQLDARLAQFPEVDRVFAKLGTADVATDPMPPSVADTYVILKEREQWPDPRKPKSALVARARSRGRARARQQLRVHAADPDALQRADLRRALRRRREGLRRRSRHAARARRARSRRCSRGVAGRRRRRARADDGPADADGRSRGARVLARYGLDVADVQDVVATAIGGRAVGQVFEGDQRFDLVIRLPEPLRNDPRDARRRCPCRCPAAATCRCASSRRSTIVEGPNAINRENGKRRAVVTANVRGRDLGSFVADARERIERERRAAGRLLARVRRHVRAADLGAERLRLVVPVTLLLIFVLLYSRVPLVDATRC